MTVVAKNRVPLSTKVFKPLEWEKRRKKQKRTKKPKSWLTTESRLSAAWRKK